MKKEAKHIVVPTQFWENHDLSWLAKIILIEIDSYQRSSLGAAIRSGAVATALGITKKECDTALKELFDKGAIQVNLDEGQKLILPLMYKDRYVATGQRVAIDGEKPTATNSIDYEEVQSKWAEICSVLPPIQRFTPQRKRKLKSALTQSQLTVGDLYKCFRIIASTQFLNGSGEFAAHFDWVVKTSQNLQKIYEGFYARSPQEKRDYEAIMAGKNMVEDKVETNKTNWQ